MKKSSISLLYGVALLVICLTNCKKDNQQVVKPPPTEKLIPFSVIVNNPQLGGTATPADTSVKAGSSVTVTFGGPRQASSITTNGVKKNIFGATTYTIANITTKTSVSVIFSDTLTTTEYNQRLKYLETFFVDTHDDVRPTGSTVWRTGPSINPCDTGTHFRTVKGKYEERYGLHPCPVGASPDSIINSGTAVMSPDGKYITTTLTYGPSKGKVVKAEIVELSATDYWFILINPFGDNQDWFAHCKPR